MATLSDLVKTLARVTGLPEATVFAYGRFAREAGFISQSGRGLGAATMIARDAANLLIAIGGTAVTREAGKTIHQFRAMRGRIVLMDYQLAASFREWLKPLGHFAKLGKKPISISVNFGDFLEFLIREAGTGGLARFLRTIPTAEIVDAEKWEANIQYDTDQLFDEGILAVKAPSEVDLGQDVLLSIKFERTTPRIDVEFKRYWDSLEHLFLIEFYRREPHVSEPDNFSVTAEVTLNTVTALGFAVSDIHVPAKLRSAEDYSDFFAKYESSRAQ